MKRQYVLVFDDQERAISLGLCANEEDAIKKAQVVLSLPNGELLGLNDDEFTWGFENGEFWVCPLTKGE